MVDASESATIYIIASASGRTAVFMIKAFPIFPLQTLPPSSLLISHMPPTPQPQVTSHHSLNMPLFKLLFFPICCFFSWSALPSFLYVGNSHSRCKTQLKCHLSSENFLTPGKKNSHSGLHCPFMNTLFKIIIGSTTPRPRKEWTWFKGLWPSSSWGRSMWSKGCAIQSPNLPLWSYSLNIRCHKALLIAQVLSLELLKVFSLGLCIWKQPMLMKWAPLDQRYGGSVVGTWFLGLFSA